MKRDLSFLESAKRAMKSKVTSRARPALWPALWLVLQGCSSSTGTVVKVDASTLPDGSSASPDVATDVASDGPGDTQAAIEAGLPDVGSPDIGSRDVAEREAAAIIVDSAVDVAVADAVVPVIDGAGSVDVLAMDVGGEAGAGFTCPAQIAPDSGVTQQLCFDFSNPASAAAFTPEAGTWSIAGGVYVANGPDAQVTCPGGDGSLMTASLLNGLSARDVRVHAKLLSVQTPDKVLVLRSRPGGNRIEVNFRANFVYQDVPQGGDLNIAELVDCVDTTYVGADGPKQVSIPHAMAQAIVVDVQLIGQQLTVIVDGKTVFDGSVAVSTQPGSVGFAVFQGGLANFDDLLVEVLN